MKLKETIRAFMLEPMRDSRSGSLTTETAKRFSLFSLREHESEEHSGFFLVDQCCLGKGPKCFDESERPAWNARMGGLASETATLNKAILQEIT